jgi:hypothetical protein
MARKSATTVGRDPEGLLHPDKDLKCALDVQHGSRPTHTGDHSFESGCLWQDREPNAFP